MYSTYRSSILCKVLPYAQRIRPLSLLCFFFNGLVFSFRPHRSSTTCHNQEDATELSFTHGSHQQKNPSTTERLQGLLNAKNGSTAVFCIVRPTDRQTDGRHSCHDSDFHINKQTAILTLNPYRTNVENRVSS